MTDREPVRTLLVRERPSRLAAARDLAIILVCAAILVGTFAELLAPARTPPPAAPAVERVCL